MLPNWWSGGSQVASDEGGRSSDGQRIEGMVSVWRMTTGRETARSRWDGGMVWSLAVTPDATTVATGFSDKIKLWNVAPGK